MIISGSQHPLKVDYRIPKYIIQLWVNKILAFVVVVVLCKENGGSIMILFWIEQENTGKNKVYFSTKLKMIWTICFVIFVQCGRFRLFCSVLSPLFWISRLPAAAYSLKMRENVASNNYFQTPCLPVLKDLFYLIRSYLRVTISQLSWMLANQNLLQKRGSKNRVAPSVIMKNKHYCYQQRPCNKEHCFSHQADSCASLPAKRPDLEKLNIQFFLREVT